MQSGLVDDSGSVTETRPFPHVRRSKSLGDLGIGVNVIRFGRVSRVTLQDSVPCQTLARHSVSGAPTTGSYDPQVSPVPKNKQKFTNNTLEYFYRSSSLLSDSWGYLGRGRSCLQSSTVRSEPNVGVDEGDGTQ